MLRRLWLIFAQAVTVALAALFVLDTLRPDWRLPLHDDGARAPVVVAPTRDAPSAHPAPASYADAARRATPAVVNINTTRERASRDERVYRYFFGDGQGGRGDPEASLGSGVVVSADGYVLTNNHVIEDAAGIEVVFGDGRRAAARVVGTDPETDLALLRVDLPAGEERALPAIEFGRDEDVHVGDVVLAIGNPFGIGSTVTMGIVSATGRANLQLSVFENFIQTDAAINPGNSGGALVDVDGRLIGINSAILTRTGAASGIGFAIPASTARQVMEGLANEGQVVRGYIGVETQDVSPELADAFQLSSRRGALITGLVRGGPAERAGVKTGDILVAIEGAPTDDSSAMLNQVARLKPGVSARLTLNRDRKQVEVTVEVGLRPRPPKARRRGE
ncbi:S1C family serine protease [Derxia gummosa]|uniref:S1C family serine protease n=1 Tax=Derxia gummosa DSM 723 TaxID=1121388 RepID=A0A8B6X717_9BURK|nr:trypsin-like peptidase domain-containing protein [Derxia gummosa]